MDGLILFSFPGFPNFPGFVGFISFLFLFGSEDIFLLLIPFEAVRLLFPCEFVLMVLLLLLLLLSFDLVDLVSISFGSGGISVTVLTN